MRRFGKLRFWLLGLVIGLVSLAIFYPNTENLTFENVASTLPDAMGTSNRSPSDTENSTHDDRLREEEVELKSSMPSNGGAISAILESAEGNFNAAEAFTEENAPDLSSIFGSPTGAAPTFGSGGLGMRGTGMGGAGIGSIGTRGGGTGYGASASQASESLPEETDTAAPDFSDAVAGFDEMLVEIDRKLASLPLANIAFNTPETIPLGDYSEIELLVSLKEAEEKLANAVAAPGPVETSRVHVSPYLEATLTGVGFRIESSNSARQLLSSSQRTRWQWQIEPTKSDKLKLDLTLNAIISINGKQHERAIETFRREILVDVPIAQRVVQVVGNNKEMLATFLIIPVGGWLWRRYRKGGKNPPSDKTPEIDKTPETRQAA